MSSRPRLAALTGLRFPAALAVALAHLPEVYANPHLTRTLRRFAAEGFAGVPFFFVLSGFVLAYSYRDRLARPVPGALAAYYRSRLARIWPLHLFALLLVLAMPLHPGAGGPGQLLANVLLVHAWVPDVGYAAAYNSVSWTLSVEVFFYLLLPAFLWVVCRRDPGPVALAAGAVLAWLVPLAVIVRHLPYTDAGTLWLCNVCPAVRFGEFAAGAFLGLLFARGGGPDRGPASARWTALEVLAVALVVAAVKWSDRVPMLLRLNGYYTPVFALVVAVFARGRGRLSAVMASPRLVYLGEISFAFFVLHAVVFANLGWALTEVYDDAGPGMTGRAGVLLAAGLLAAAAAHRWVEVPARELILGGVQRPGRDVPRPVPVRRKPRSRHVRRVHHPAVR
jgi:peptidoglycan/LPS O-acetylase OafA/YrhL